jgi:hypothetical protein
LPEPIDTSKLGRICIQNKHTSTELMIRVLMSAKANGNPAHYLAGLNVAESHACGQRMEEMRAAMQEFIDRVDKGEVRSKRTYAKFKKILQGE